MTDTKMLQVLIDGQVQIREDIKRVEKKVDDGFKKTNERMDRLGMQIA